MKCVGDQRKIVVYLDYRLSYIMTCDLIIESVLMVTYYYTNTSSGKLFVLVINILCYEYSIKSNIAL